MDIVNSFSTLHLDLLGEEWMQQVWDSDFLEVEEIANEYEEFMMENDVLFILEPIVEQLRLSLGRRQEGSGNEQDDTTSDSEVSWELMVENRVEHRYLLSLLAYFIVKGQKKSDMKSMEIGFKACSFYYLLLSIPGCDAFFVFQPGIYENSLKMLNVMQSIFLNESRQSKPSGGRRRGINNFDVNDDDEGDDDEEGSNTFIISGQAKIHITKCLCNVLSDQLQMIKRYPLKTEDFLEKTIIQLISQTRLANSTTLLEFDTLKINGDISSFACNSFCLLKALCLPLHGRTEETVRLILYYLLPNILMSGDFVKGMTMNQLGVIRHQTEKFVLYLLNSLAGDTYEGICIWIQHICARVTDKADYRLKVSQSIVYFLKALPYEPYFQTIKWLLRFAHDVKASHRLFALEVISRLLYEDERPNDVQERNLSVSSPPVSASSSDDENNLESSNVSLNNGINSQQTEKDVASHKFLLGVLFSRCHDQSSTVRTKALSTLSDCLRSNNRVLVELMQEVFVTPYMDNDLIENDSTIERGFLNPKIFLDSLDKPAHQQVDPLPGGKAVVNAILELIEDDKVFVRKSAFTFLECVMRLNHKWMTDKLLKPMCNHIRDPTLLIKKQLIQSLTDLLLMYPKDLQLAKYYVDSVIPQISHPELKIQEKVIEVLNSSILQQLVPFNKLNSPLTYLPWKILELVVELKRRKFFQIICSHWAKNNMLPKNLLPLIQSHISTQHNIAAWLLLSCIAPYTPIKNPKFVVEYYRENVSNLDKRSRYAVVKALDVLGSCWKYLAKDEQDSICTEFIEAVENTQLCITFIGPVLDVVFLITMGRTASVKEGQEAVMEWSKKIMDKMEEYFQHNSPCRHENIQENVHVNMEKFMRNLVTLGDIAQLLPGRVPVNVAVILTGIIFPEKLRDPVKWSIPGLQALTIVTLGKMCLQNECLAKRVIPAFGLLLAESKDEAVKVNVMNTLSDICVRFTAVVEPLLSEMCVCLKDNSVIVRHHTVTVFVRLLQQDFLKLRGSLLFHMMSMLVDPVPNIAQLANYYMTQCVITRNKNIMCQNIVESIFYFNKYEIHPLYSKIKLSAQESHLFNLSGPEHEAKRQILYRFMCEHMIDEHRMQATHKICTDILGGVSNESVVLDAKGECVLQDAFFVLSCEEICLHSLRGQSEDEPPTDDVERVTAAVNTAKKNIISQCVKKQTIEIIIPIIVQLKGKLQAVMSPLLNNLMSYLRNILKDYKSEIAEIFSEDKTMAEEILYDMKRFEEEQKNRAAKDSEDEVGEVDHMRPLLVELATDHLCRTIQNKTTQSTLQSQTVEPGGSDVQTSAEHTGFQKSPSKSPCDTNEKNGETEINPYVEESLPGPSGRQRRSVSVPRSERTSLPRRRRLESEESVTTSSSEISTRKSNVCSEDDPLDNESKKGTSKRKIKSSSKGEKSKKLSNKGGKS